MRFPEELAYVKTHEWVRVEGEVATIGITDFAQEELGEVVYLELPDVGDEVRPDAPFGVIESIKAVSDLLTGLTGVVTEVNAALVEAPEAVNEDPYGRGWLIKVKLSDEGELDSLLSAADYQQLIQEA